MKGDGDALACTVKSVATRVEQKPQEPSLKCTIVRPPKTNKETVPLADRELHSIMTVSTGQTQHIQLPTEQSPQTQHRDGESRGEAERLVSGPEQKPGFTVAGASHTNKTQVRV